MYVHEPDALPKRLTAEVQATAAAAEQSAAAEAALTAARRDAEASAAEGEARAGELLELHSQACAVIENLAWSLDYLRTPGYPDMSKW